MSYGQLAKDMGVSSMTVSKWVRGGGISDDRLDELCTRLSATRSWLRWGEDFFDDSIWVEAQGQSGLLRSYMNSSHRLSLASMIEGALGYVNWMLDSETGTWQWSGNAHRFFGLQSARERCDMGLHSLIFAAMTEQDALVARRMLADVMAGSIQQGWHRYALRHKPNRAYFAILRNVPDHTGRWRVFGLTVSSGTLLGDFVGRWTGPSSSYEADRTSGKA